MTSDNHIRKNALKAWIRSSILKAVTLLPQAECAPSKMQSVATIAGLFRRNLHVLACVLRYMASNPILASTFVEPHQLIEDVCPPSMDVVHHPGKALVGTLADMLVQIDTFPGFLREAIVGALGSLLVGHPDIMMNKTNQVCRLTSLESRQAVSNFRCFQTETLCKKLECCLGTELWMPKTNNDNCWLCRNIAGITLPVLFIVVVSRHTTVFNKLSTEVNNAGASNLESISEPAVSKSDGKSCANVPDRHGSRGGDRKAYQSPSAEAG